MRDNQELMMRFAKIVERHPEIYDHNLDAYKTRQVDTAWEKVAVSVRMELKEECTVEELKMRWKGLRSSFNRYKNKLLNPSDTKLYKKYYLYDTLKFLDPFTSPKGAQHKDSILEEYGLYDDTSKTSQDNTSADEWNISETKPDIFHKQMRPEAIVSHRLNNTDIVECANCENMAKKRKCSNKEDENEDLNFFKSILPEIKDFTHKEKRKLKMGILKLIDDIENEKKQE